MNEKCKILGYARYTSKEDQSEKLRINIAIPYENNCYYGFLPLKTLFLSYSKELEDILYESVKNEKLVKINYETKIASQKIEIVGFSPLNEEKEYVNQTIPEDFL